MTISGDGDSDTSSFGCNVKLYDDGADTEIRQGYIDPPEGYKVRDTDWVDKSEEVRTYPEDWRSELGF